MAEGGGGAYHHRDGQRRGTNERGRERSHGARDVQRQGIRYLKWNEITEMAASTSDEVLDTLNTNEAGFLKVFSHDESCRNPRILKALVKIVYLLVKSKEPDLASRVLARIYSPDANCAQFCFQVDRLIKIMPTAKEQRYIKQNMSCLQYLIEIGQFGVEKIPTTMIESFPQATISGTVNAFKKSGYNVHALEIKCQELELQFQFALMQIESPSTVAADRLAPNDDDLEPPQNFTTIPILPQTQDLIGNQKPFLRCNKTKGPYNGWDHYLDVQFRLLREDFIEPLREGITGDLSLCHNAAIRMYEGVHVLEPVCLVSGMGFEITFDITRFRRTNWEHSRRLIFGSLLCLSNQDFKEGSIIFATVVKREAKKLEEGCLIIKFEGEANGFHIDPEDEYTMVESTAYFEAYRHVLCALQNASLFKDVMPFKKYIIECQLHDPHPPLHISKLTTSFNLIKVLQCRGAGYVGIARDSTWPHCISTGLDRSQYEALKMALRQEVTCIQGPPGTGKTFIGLKLVQTFLHNRLAWDPKKNSPILLVCYTNHALDQFLEEIIDVYSNDSLPPPDIVRIGGRCKSEKLANCVLAQKVSDMRSSRSLPGHMYRESRDLRSKVNCQKERFSTILAQISSSDHKMFTLSELQLVIPREHYLQLSQGMLTDHGKEIEVWLNLWKPTEAFAFDEMEDYQKVFQVEEEAEEDEEESNSEDDMVAVDEEATLLQDERITEGEDMFLVEKKARKKQPVKSKKKKAGVGEWQTVQISEKEKARRIKRGFKCNAMDEQHAARVKDVRLLKESGRWQMYHYWVRKYLRIRKEEMQYPAEAYNIACNEYTRIKHEIDCHVARGAEIIGMTTTGAAKHHHILKNIHPKIVLIEEAAEVFESHVITSLSPSVQQLILIGDHKQLRPKPNSYKLEKEYHLDVSLFERLIDNGIPHVTLTVQHRMRPDIADLIHPAIYDTLENGPRAIEHGAHKIAGVGNNLFFLHHTFPEKHQNPNESMSHVNVHEAEMMVALCRYLLKQGYKTTQITLLTMYRGQLLEIKKNMKRKEFEGVRVAAVDDFQGEENDIILLSLVRSNSDGNIGFLKIQNRVCVALSRARKGLFVIGNLLMLRGREDTIWPKIISVVDGKNCTGEAIHLQCQIHPDQVVRARVASDFSKCPEGGCTKPCNYRLSCGHGCTRLCHPWDRDHKLFKCQKICNKHLSCHHRCKGKCHECASGCGPCKREEDKVIPRCGHKVRVACSLDLTTILCSAPCKKKLSCGHSCQGKCSEPCDMSYCSVEVEKTLPCGHTTKVPCHKTTERILCTFSCKTLLQCEHECKGTCGRCSQGRLHVHCQSECGRTLVCGHVCNSPCPKECPPCLQKCSNYCRHSHCPNNCYEPCVSCAEPCEWKCEHLKCTKNCGELCNRPRCDMPCRKLLKCGHPCIGLCGDTCPKLCCICDEEKVTEVFFGSEDEPGARFVQLQDCNHVFESTGLDHWMDQPESGEVQFKKCPRCSTLIRTSLRYYNEVKKVHYIFEEIKKKQLQMTSISDVLLPLLMELYNKNPSEEISPAVKKIETLLSKRTRPRYILPHCLNSIQNQLRMLPTLSKMYQELRGVVKKSWQLQHCKIRADALHSELEQLQHFLMQDSLTDQQLSDIQCEMKRLHWMVRLFKVNSFIKERIITLTSKENEGLITWATYFQYSGIEKYDIPKISEEMVERVSRFIADLENKYSLGGVSEKDRIEIVKAIGLAKGRWFKCPNGHYYIGDCGGAVVGGTCPECKARIGGTHHTLLADNVFAPEMDGAAYPAWSDQANLANYDLR